MAIKEEKPITLAQVQSMVGDGERSQEVKEFLKNFKMLTLKKAEDLKKDLEGLKMLRLKEEHIVKIVDFLPQDASELNKVLSDVSLDESEVTKIVDVVKKY